MEPKKKKARKMQTEKDLVDNVGLDRLDALVNFAKKTQSNTLDLADRQLGKKDVECILNILSDLQATELNLKSNCLKNEMADLAPLLTKTRIKKLDVSYCGLTKVDLLQLLEVLKDSQITDLIILGYGWAEDHKFKVDEAQKFISHLQKAKLKTLIFDFLFNLFPQNNILSFVQEFLNTSITCIDLSGFTSNDLISLFSNLDQSSVTELSLMCTYNIPDALQKLSRKLVATKIEKLNLSGNRLNEVTLNILVNGIVGSKVTDLTLEDYRFSSLGPLFAKIKETHVRMLNLSGTRHLRHETFIYPDSFRCSRLTVVNLSRCNLNDLQGEGLMESLKLSNVTELDISHNNFGSLTVKKCAENIRYINLVDLDISYNDVPLDGFFILGICLKESNLKRINVSKINGADGVEAAHSSDLLSFLKLTEGSCVSKIEMNNYPNTWKYSPACEVKLVNTRLKELSLSNCGVRYGFSGLIRHLKFTTLSHLNLSDNEILDDGATAIAGCLKDSQIRRLNLDINLITSQGAKALARSFKDSNLLYLHLSANQIKDDGLEYLAEHAKDTFITVLDVSHNPGEKISLVDNVLWQNKLAAEKLSVFKQIMPLNSDAFCFHQNSDSLDVSAFLEKCMWFYKTTIHNPLAITVLLEMNSDLFSRDQIFKLVHEAFPRQFSDFIAKGLEAGLTDHVSILKKAEDMGLTAIVESLLLHRPIYLLDKEQDILHPFVYKLLLQYKQPICSLAVDPLGVMKIIKYFDKHMDIEGAQDLTNLLRSSNISQPLPP